MQTTFQPWVSINQFFSNERWRACFESPIECGMVMAAMVAWLCLPLLLFPSHRALRVVVSIMAAGAAVCLALTGSRGPILAGLLLFIAIFFLTRRHGLVLRRYAAVPCVTGLMALLLSLFIFPAGKRIGDMVGGGDASILNRLELWRAAGPMSFIEPLTGIGIGESGHFFSQWYQPERLNYSYTGLLNSYLEIAVERGLPALGLVLFFGFMVMASVWFGVCRGPDCQVRLCLTAGKSDCPRYVSAFGICAAVSLLPVLLCGLTCTAQDYMTVNWIVLFNVVVLCTRAFVLRRVLPWAKLASGTACFAALALAGLWGWGRLYVGDYDLRAGLTEGGAIRLIKTETPGGEVSADAQKLLVFCDRAELGTLYGKKLRAMLSASPLYREFVILDPRRAPPETLPMGNYDIAVFGNAVRWLPSLPPLGTKRWLVIHPRGGFVMPPKEILMTVWLPKYDSTGGDAAWRKETRAGIMQRESGSLGGFCGMDVINQAKGFFW
ncbi:O-antigen ligase family protein [Termitidicoccus mucosus]